MSGGVRCFLGFKNIELGEVEMSSFKRLKVSRKVNESDNDHRKQESKLTSICANPLDRFCDLLLKWKFSADQCSIGLSSVPLCFDSYSSYMNVFEPMVIEETKAAVLSKLQEKAIKTEPQWHTYCRELIETSTIMPIAKLSFNQLFAHQKVSSSQETRTR